MSRISVLMAAAVVAIFGIASFAFAVQKCGAGKAFLLGNGAFFAAVTGMCDH